MLIGHELLVKNFEALATSDKLGHGYLFYGPEGVGRKLFALSLANFLASRGASASDGKNLAAGEVEFDYDAEKAPILGDAILIGPDEKKTIGIDRAREIKYFLYQKPNQSSRRTVIIDEAEFLTTEAQNALLKITEEPPASSLLILVVRDSEILMPTLASRLQSICFSSLPIKLVAEWLIKEHSVSKTEAERLARDSFGSPGLAVKMLSSEIFKETRKLAEKFLKVSGSERREFIKKLIDPPAGGGNFDILAFLDAVILQITNNLQIYEFSGSRSHEMDTELWHRVLKLRKDFSNFPLNPRLQLESLLVNETKG